MDSNTVPADVRWAIANWPESAERGEVSRFCERQGISRSVFYKIRRQALEQGPVGATEPGSRRPLKSPGRTDPDMMRHLLQTMINTLLCADADAVVGAEWGKPTPGRATQRNGYRHRDLDTRVGTLDVAIPKLRAGTYSRSGCSNAASGPNPR